MFALNIHCSTIHQMELLFEYLIKNEFKWADGVSLKTETHWDEHKEDTCYYVIPHTKRVEYQTVRSAKRFNEPIVEFESIADQVVKGI